MRNIVAIFGVEMLRAFVLGLYERLKFIDGLSNVNTKVASLTGNIAFVFVGIT